MTPAAEPLHPPGTEIARLKLPMPASALFGISKALEKAYGKGLRLSPLLRDPRGGLNPERGDWYVVTTPTEKDIELDRRRDRERRAAARTTSGTATKSSEEAGS